MEKKKVVQVWTDKDRIYARLDTGEVASYAFSQWLLLAQADERQRNSFVLSAYGIHWPQLDEDLSFEGMFRDCHLCDGRMEEDQFLYSPTSKDMGVRA